MILLHAGAIGLTYIDGIAAGEDGAILTHGRDYL